MLEIRMRPLDLEEEAPIPGVGEVDRARSLRANTAVATREFAAVPPRGAVLPAGSGPANNQNTCSVAATNDSEIPGNLPWHSLPPLPGRLGESDRDESELRPPRQRLPGGVALRCVWQLSLSRRPDACSPQSLGKVPGLNQLEILP